MFAECQEIPWKVWKEADSQVEGIVGKAPLLGRAVSRLWVLLGILKQ